MNSCMSALNIEPIFFYIEESGLIGFRLKFVGSISEDAIREMALLELKEVFNALSDMFGIVTCSAYSLVCDFYGSADISELISMLSKFKMKFYFKINLSLGENTIISTVRNVRLYDCNTEASLRRNFSRYLINRFSTFDDLHVSTRFRLGYYTNTCLMPVGDRYLLSINPEEVVTLKQPKSVLSRRGFTR